MEEKSLPLQGWQCPVCKNVMSPFTLYCIFCADSKPTTDATKVVNGIWGSSSTYYSKPDDNITLTQSVSQ